MGILTPFTSPHDIRWQHGAQRHHHTLFLLKTLILIPFTIIIIVEFALLRSWKGYSSAYDLADWSTAPYHFWLRIGMAYFPDLLFTLISLVLILNPMHRATYAFHPVFALVQSLVMAIMWAAVSGTNPALAWSEETFFEQRQEWEQIAYAETGFQVAVCLLWGAMVVLSCIAVHRWRSAGKNGDVRMEQVKGGNGNDAYDERV